MLNEALLAHPKHYGLLRARIQVFLAFGEWQKALADLDNLIVTGGGFPEINLYRCLILEHLAALEKEFMACYKQICSDYAGKKEYLPTDYFNWALVELLAGNRKKAEELVERSRAYPELMTDELWNALLPGGVFDRRALVNGLLPVKNK